MECGKEGEMRIGKRMVIVSIEFGSKNDSLWWIQDGSFKYYRLVGIDIVTGGTQLAWAIELVIFPMLIGFSISKRFK